MRNRRFLLAWSRERPLYPMIVSFECDGDPGYGLAMQFLDGLGFVCGAVVLL